MGDIEHYPIAPMDLVDDLPSSRRPLKAALDMVDAGKRIREELRAEVVRLEAELAGAVSDRDELRHALEHLAKPEWSKTGDGPAMRRYAQRVLNRLGGR